MFSVKYCKCHIKYHHPEVIQLLQYKIMTIKKEKRINYKKKGESLSIKGKNENILHSWLG